MDFPITVKDFLSIAGLSLFAGLLVQWLKEWILEKSLLNVVVLALAVLAAIVAQVIIAEWKPTGEQVFAAVLIGFFSASVTTFGYELVVNVRGMLGKGDRA